MTNKADISFHISTTSGSPIFRQLVDQVTRLVACQQLREGELMPSVNEVSRRLAVNPMTISRAYNLLTEQGILERQRGIGMRVAAGATKPLPERLGMLDPKIDELMTQAEQLGIDPQTVIKHLQSREEPK